MIFLGQAVNINIEINVKGIPTHTYVMTNRGHLQKLGHN
jgi:hypothetical protein